MRYKYIVILLFVLFAACKKANLQEPKEETIENNNSQKGKNSSIGESSQNNAKNSANNSNKNEDKKEKQGGEKDENKKIGKTQEKIEEKDEGSKAEMEKEGDTNKEENIQSDNNQKTKEDEARENTPNVETPKQDEMPGKTEDKSAYSVEARRGKTWFMKGLKMEGQNGNDWKPIDNTTPHLKGLPWDKKYGWYDVNKENASFNGKDKNLCWAAVASNLMHWWLNQNKKYIDLFDKNHKIPNNFESSSKSDIYDLYKKHFINEGNDLKTSIEWFFNGKHNTEASAGLKDIPGAGFFKEVFTKDLFPKTSDIDDDSYVYQQGFFRPVKKIGFGPNDFSDIVAKALVEGHGIACEIKYPRGYLHAISIWGAEFDKNGKVSYLYITDSNDPELATQANNKYQTQAGLIRKSIKCRETHEEGLDPGVYHADSTPKAYHNYQITYLHILPLFQKEWEEYFKKKGISVPQSN